VVQSARGAKSAGKERAGAVPKLPRAPQSARPHLPSSDASGGSEGIDTIAEHGPRNRPGRRLKPAFHNKWDKPAPPVADRNSRNVMPGSDEYYELMLGRKKTAAAENKPNYNQWTTEHEDQVVEPWLRERKRKVREQRVRKNLQQHDERHYIDHLHDKQQVRYRAKARELMKDLHKYVSQTAMAKPVPTSSKKKRMEQQKQTQAQISRLV
jgi:hypothetical protein